MAEGNKDKEPSAMEMLDACEAAIVRTTALLEEIAHAIRTGDELNSGGTLLSREQGSNGAGVQSSIKKVLAYVNTTEVRTIRTLAIVNASNNTSAECRRSISLLFDLPMDCFQKFFSTWLVLQEICLLDVAVSDAIHREHWLRCLRECRPFYGRTFDDPFYKLEMRWIGARNVPIKHVVCYLTDFLGLYPRFEKEQRLGGLPTLPKSWISLYVKGSGGTISDIQVLQTLLVSCKNLRGFGLLGVDVTITGMEFVETIGKALPNLASLRLIHQYVPYDGLAYWMDAFKDLRHIHMEYCTSSNRFGIDDEDDEDDDIGTDDVIDGICASDAAYLMLAKKGTRLEELELIGGVPGVDRYCGYEIGLHSIVAISEHCKSLKALHIFPREHAVISDVEHAGLSGRFAPGVFPPDYTDRTYSIFHGKA